VSPKSPRSEIAAGVLELTGMFGKKTSRLASIGAVLISICLTGSFPLTQAAFENQAGGNKNDSVAYVKQITQDICYLPNRNPRLRTAASSRPTDPGQGLAQPWPPATLPWPGLIRPLLVELPNPRALAVFNPTTRPPPA
jgi:hypothetical protein